MLRRENPLAAAFLGLLWVCQPLQADDTSSPNFSFYALHGDAARFQPGRGPATSEDLIALSQPQLSLWTIAHETDPAASLASRPDDPTTIYPASQANSLGDMVRAGVIDWIGARNTLAAQVSDFVIPGSDLPVHLDIDPGDKAVTLKWQINF